MKLIGYDGERAFRDAKSYDEAKEKRKEAMAGGRYWCGWVEEKLT